MKPSHPLHADEPALPGAADDLSPDAAAPLDEAATPEEGLVSLEAEIARAKDARLRAEAELQNLRRRHLRELDDAERAGAARMVAPVLSLVDDLDRALESATAAGTGETALAQGVALARQRLLDALAAAGLVALSPLGEPFDPHAHEALLHAPHESVPAGHVAQVIARGFRQGERILRAARVVVSSGTPGKD